MELLITGIDKDRPKTVYFSRIAPGEPGCEVIELPMPLSPAQLQIEIVAKNKADEGEYEIKEIASDLMPKLRRPLEHEAVQFFEIAKYVAENANYIPYRTYSKGPYKIQYSDYVRDDDGTIQGTPARMDHYKGEIQAAGTAFKNQTVVMSLAMLYHEFYHDYTGLRGDDKQTQVIIDKNAARALLTMGFPQTEISYVLTRVIPGHSADDKDRIRQVSDFIYQFNNDIII